MEQRIQKNVRPTILSLTPYSCAREEFDGSNAILLDANENSLSASLSSDLNRYPDPYQRAVKEKLAPVVSLPEEQIFLGNGSDEAIDLLLRVFCEPNKDSVVIFPPTYGMYEVSANINAISVIKIPLGRDFSLDPEQTLSAINENTKLLFVCSPNNPTGNAISFDAIESLSKNFDGYVIVDEAYVDFCPEKSVVSLIEEYDNLILLRTFSKAWGLAGIRLGMVLARKEIINLLNKVKAPYNISSINQFAAIDAIENKENKDQSVSNIIALRKELAKELKAKPSVEQVFPSDANFLLVRFKNSDKVFNLLTKKRVIVRDRSSLQGCKNCLRITVGTKQENEMLLDVISEVN